MKSLHQSAQLARTLAPILNVQFKDFWIDELYSNSKTELVLCLKKDKTNYGYLVFNFVADNLLILFSEQVRKRSRLAKDHFELSNQAQIKGAVWVENERVVEITLSNQTSLFLCFYGRRADVIHQNGTALNSFRNSQNALNLVSNIQSPQVNYQTKDWESFWQENRFLPAINTSKPFSTKEAESYVESLASASIVMDEKKLILAKNKLSLDEQKVEIHEFNLHFLKNFNQERREKEEESRKLKYVKSINQRLAAAKNKLLKLAKNNRFLTWADVIMSNLATLDPNAHKQELMDWTTQTLIVVPLNTEKSPIDNANKYYQKAKNVHKEIAFLKSKINNLEKELDSPVIPNQKTTQEKQVARPYYTFEFEGVEIRVGKSAEKNDELIKFHSHKNDLWLHAKDVPGSHVIIRNPNNKKISKELLEYAASLAAKYSKQKGQTLAAVCYTQRKYVRKNKKMLPGQVRLEKEEALLVKPMD